MLLVLLLLAHNEVRRSSVDTSANNLRFTCYAEHVGGCKAKTRSHMSIPFEGFFFLPFVRLVHVSFFPDFFKRLLHFGLSLHSLSFMFGKWKVPEITLLKHVALDELTAAFFL